MSAPVAVGSDHAGLKLKTHLIGILNARGVETEELSTHSGASCDYPTFAHAVAAKVASGAAPWGLLVCGTGVGMSIAANRTPGVRAAVVSDPFSAHATRAHNDANVLCLGERVVGTGVAEAILDAWLSTAFEGGRHQRRVLAIEPTST